MQTTTPLHRTIELLGGVVAAAAVLKVRYQTVQQWARTGSVPAKYCPDIERATQGRVRCEELRDDIDWGYLRGTSRRRPAHRIAA